MLTHNITKGWLRVNDEFKLKIGDVIEWRGDRGIIIPDPLTGIPDTCAGDPEIVCIAWSDSHEWDRYGLYIINMAYQREDFKICCC